jgi:ABC-type branched-subunit amino acid transport system substrate-binding protein
VLRPSGYAAQSARVGMCCDEAAAAAGGAAFTPVTAPLARAVEPLVWLPPNGTSPPDEQGWTCDWSLPVGEAGRVPQPIVRVGLLASVTSAAALSERSVLDAALLAVDNLNAMGGVLGKLVVPVVGDGGGSAARFASEAGRLLAGGGPPGGVVALFGGSSTAVRKALAPVVEARGSLLFYPARYEGQECSRNIIYGGATPAHQMSPVLEWTLKYFPHAPYFLLGSDEESSRTMHSLIRFYFSKGACERGTLAGCLGS